MKRGFTLLEVCLAVAVMSAGVLSVVILYSMGFRETRQGVEDTGSAAYADAVLSPLVNALSATNLSWQAFNNVKNNPEKGWWGYFDDKTKGLIHSDPTGKARSVFGSVPNAPSFPALPSNLKAGLVIRHEEGSSVIKIAFRATRNTAMLMSAPLYYTEVHFQGDPEK